jgi:hypothetical protein
MFLFQKIKSCFSCINLQLVQTFQFKNQKIKTNLNWSKQNACAAVEHTKVSIIWTLIFSFSHSWSIICMLFWRFHWQWKFQVVLIILQQTEKSNTLLAQILYFFNSIAFFIILDNNCNNMCIY